MNSLPLILIIFLLGFPQIGETIYTPSLPDIARAFATSDTLAELTLGVFFLGFAFGVLIWGYVADRIGRRPTMLIGLAIYLMGSLGCCLSPSIAWLLGFRVLQALGASVGSVVTLTMLRDVYSGKERSKIFGQIGAALAISPAIGPMIGGYMDEWVGWEGNFVILALIGLLLLIYSYFVLPETKHPEKTKTLRAGFLETARRMIFHKKVWGYSFLIGASNGILFSYYAEGPFIFIDLLNFTPSHYGLLGIVVGAASMMASALSHRLSTYFSYEKIISLCCTTMVLGTLALSLNAFFGVISVDKGLLATFAFIGPLTIIFAAMWILVPNCLSHALEDYQEMLGTASSLFGFSYYMLIALFTALIGYFHNGTSLPLPLYLFALSSLMLVTGYFCIIKKNVEAPVNS